MKIIFKIAKNELRNLFYSPVAWFLAIVFLVQCALFYTSMLTPYAMFQDQLQLNDPKWKDFGDTVTKAIFLSPSGIFMNVYQNLYLYIPLLTMGLISREVNSGTIKLLYSSPVKLREIILGKYLAVMIYNFILVLIVGIFIVSGALNIKSVDMGLLLSAELGFYLLVCAFSAIGLFMSSLSTYQIVSGIGSFVTIFVLSRIGGLWQKYDFVRDLTYFLSISGRTEKMLGGLITTKDVFYFLTVIFMFLSFTLFKLKGERESKPWTVKAGRYIVVIIVSVMFGYITSRPFLTGYWDTTACQVNTIAPRTQKILKEMGDEPLEVTLYTNLMGTRFSAGLPEGRNPYLSALWDQYLRFKPDIKFKYVYYYDNDGKLDDSAMYKNFPHKTEKQIAGIMAKMFDADESLFIGPDEIRKQITPNDENGALFLSVKYKNRVIHLRTFNDTEFWPDQSQIASEFKRLVEGAPPKVYYLTGNLERNIYKTGEREYSTQSVEKLNRTSLINLGFDVDTISLDNHDIPADMKMLVIADPKTELSALTLSRIQNYVDKGGNLYILGEPGKQAMLNPVLKSLGVQMSSGTLVQLSKNETPDKVIAYGTDSSFNLAEERKLTAFIKARKDGDYDDSLKICMPGVTALTYDEKGPFTITPILKTSKNKTWLKKGPLVIDSVPPVFTPQNGDVREPSFVTAIQMNRQVNGKQQRIIVCADADFKNNLRISGDLYSNAFFSWLDDNIYPVYIPAAIPKDVKLTITLAGATTLKIVYVWILPGMLLLASVILLIRRKRK
jgi:ABC-2 type transport system permease protein